MKDDFILNFPILRSESADFNNDVLYKVEAESGNQTVIVTHTLEGRSFIKKLVSERRAKFSVSLYYKDSAERRYNAVEDKRALSIKNDSVVAKQVIDNEFSYMPQITPSIVIIDGENLDVDTQSGLSNFWEIGEKLVIPRYARVAYHSTLSFDDGKVSSLIHVAMDKDHKPGTLTTRISEYAKTGEMPVTVLCSQDVYDELSKVTQAPANDLENALRSAIVTQILCAIYGYVSGLEDKENDDINTNLLAHLDLLKEKTGQDWQDENFNPSLAATEMWPYAVQTLKGKEYSDD